MINIGGNWRTFHRIAAPTVGRYRPFYQKQPMRTRREAAERKLIVSRAGKQFFEILGAERA